MEEEGWIKSHYYVCVCCVLFPGRLFCSLWQSRRESFTLKLDALLENIVVLSPPPSSRHRFTHSPTDFLPSLLFFLQRLPLSLPPSQSFSLFPPALRRFVALLPFTTLFRCWSVGQPGHQISSLGETLEGLSICV